MFRPVACTHRCVSQSLRNPRLSPSQTTPALSHTPVYWCRGSVGWVGTSKIVADTRRYRTLTIPAGFRPARGR